MLLVSCLLAFTDGFSTAYVLQRETKDWGLGAIVDIKSVAPNEQCPASYEAVEGYFPGTREYCVPYISLTPYVVGTCKKNKYKGINYDGLKESTFK